MHYVLCLKMSETEISYLNHCVSLDLRECDDVVQVVDELVRGLAHGTQVLAILYER